MEMAPERQTLSRQPLSAAVIVSTYNWPEALVAVLRSLNAQTCPPAEVIIADDGSARETARAVETAMRQTSLQWCHVRQEDSGFRQARARNLGVRFSHAAYLIFIDHDTVVHPDFVADHLRFSAPGLFLLGKRVFLPPGLTGQIIADRQSPFVPPAIWHKSLGNRKNALRAPWLGRLGMAPKKFQTSLRGSNLSVHRQDFMTVDGFDEFYDQAWGREDSDFCYRLFHVGLKCRNLWFSALQYHLHHPTTAKRKGRDHLDEELDRVRAEKRKKAINGFSKMSAEGELVSSSDGWPLDEQP